MDKDYLKAVCYNCSEKIFGDQDLYFDDFDGIDRPVCKKCHEDIKTKLEKGISR